MIARTHKIVALAGLTTVAVYFPQKDLGWLTVGLVLIANVIGSLLPDIDQASNRLWDLLPGGDWLGKAGKHLFVAHRTLSHSILGAFLVYKLIYWLLPQILNSDYINYDLVAMGLMIGYVSHLSADSFTEEGLPILFPLKINFGIPPIKPWRIKTGKWFENLVVFPGVIVYLVLLAASNWKVLTGII